MDSPTSRRSSRCLLFDRRYGWVVDEWKEPSEEALAGGRGMFCILPLAKTVLQTASQSIKLAATSTVKVLDRPDVFLPQVLQANIGDQFQKLSCLMRKPEIKCFNLGGNVPPPHTQTKNTN